MTTVDTTCTWVSWYYLRVGHVRFAAVWRDGEAYRFRWLIEPGSIVTYVAPGGGAGCVRVPGVAFAGLLHATEHTRPLINGLWYAIMSRLPQSRDPDLEFAYQAAKRLHNPDLSVGDRAHLTASADLLPLLYDKARKVLTSPVEIDEGEPL